MVNLDTGICDFIVFVSTLEQQVQGLQNAN